MDPPEEEKRMERRKEKDEIYKQDKRNQKGGKLVKKWKVSAEKVQGNQRRA